MPLGHAGSRVVLITDSAAGEELLHVEVLLAPPLPVDEPALELLTAALDPRLADPAGARRAGRAYRHRVELISASGTTLIKLDVMGSGDAVGRSLAATFDMIEELATGVTAARAGADHGQLVRHLTLSRLLACEQPGSLAESYLEVSAGRRWMDWQPYPEWLRAVTRRHMTDAARAVRDADLLVVARGLDESRWRHCVRSVRALADLPVQQVG